ncbi:MAG: hypothetical protein ABIE23_02375 [archaeon]
MSVIEIKQGLMPLKDIGLIFLDYYLNTRFILRDKQTAEAKFNAAFINLYKHFNAMRGTPGAKRTIEIINTAFARADPTPAILFTLLKSREEILRDPAVKGKLRNLRGTSRLLFDIMQKLDKPGALPVREKRGLFVKIQRAILGQSTERKVEALRNAQDRVRQIRVGESRKPIGASVEHLLDVVVMDMGHDPMNIQVIGKERSGRRKGSAPTKRKPIRRR